MRECDFNNILNNYDCIETINNKMISPIKYDQVIKSNSHANATIF